jgi:hypothetical protein
LITVTRIGVAVSEELKVRPLNSRTPTRITRGILFVLACAIRDLAKKYVALSRISDRSKSSTAG